MLLTISTTHQPTTDLGYLFHKHPDKLQTFSISAGKAHFFYPEVEENKITACLLLEIDPIGLVRKSGSSKSDGFALENYVNDRPYVCGSFMSQAIAEVLGTALNGRCKDKPSTVTLKMPFEIQLSVVKAKGGKTLIDRLFEPLGYEIEAEPHVLDEKFTAWGTSNYFSLSLKKTATLKEILTHLYVLLPILDGEKHYWVGNHEVEKLLEKGEGWLATHPEKELITKRYLKNLKALTKIAFSQLIDSEEITNEEDANLEPELQHPNEISLKEKRISLHALRLEAVLEKLKSLGVSSVLDLGCGEGKLLRMLWKDNQFQQILGTDVSFRALEIAKEKLYYEQFNERQKQRLSIIQGSLLYRDTRLNGFQAACLVEVIEHLDLPRLQVMERVIFEFAKPDFIIVTTPNAEYNIKYETLTAGNFRHTDHRFEWTRAEFEHWANETGKKFGYEADFSGIGEADEQVGASSQMAVFSKI
ncbi:MAG: 3' terminal RNA ribose 2'-O-methyltransferase Hen1 [Verrucomicrobia bacterium]|nr:3' terminal RNA ribose 2'-O-methyltransferase Hen1 [Cytophagales bacterium]